MKPHYQIGEVVLMNWHGWLKAFRVIAIREVTENEVVYEMAMVELEKDAPQWTRPTGGLWA
jgi:hypothetical protein